MRSCSDILMNQDAEFEFDVLAYYEPLKLILYRCCNAIELFKWQEKTSSSVDDRLQPNDTALWQANKGDIAVVDSAQD